MTLRHIRIFWEVCQQGNSITRAAHSLYMTQPAVSQAIRELEEHYGLRLFERYSRRLYITPAGQRLYQHAGQLLQQVARDGKKPAKRRGRRPAAGGRHRDHRLPVSSLLCGCLPQPSPPDKGTGAGEPGRYAGAAASAQPAGSGPDRERRKRPGADSGGLSGGHAERRVRPGPPLCQRPDRDAGAAARPEFPAAGKGQRRPQGL